MPCALISLRLRLHPPQICGTMTAQEVLTLFMETFEGPGGNKDGMVTLDEFCKYYRLVRTCCAAMRTAWGDTAVWPMYMYPVQVWWCTLLYTTCMPTRSSHQHTQSSLC